MPDDLNTRPCEDLVGETLNGHRQGNVWKVVDKIEKRPDSTGGTFSIGYIVEDGKGTRHFLKAADIGLITQDEGGSAFERMATALGEQQFERAILDICRGNNMDRIVHAVDYGELQTTENGVRDYVFFIIFELAQGDVRHQADKMKRKEMAWASHALHNLTVAIQQLHSQQITHNDIKPSNLLVFEDYLQKLADLGRATAHTTPGPWDQLPYAGDRTYAAPEFWNYRIKFPTYAGRIAFSVREASDLYLVGSMGFFFATGQTLTPLIQKGLRPEHWDCNWCGTFQDVLPYIQDSFSAALEYLDRELPRDEKGNLTKEASEYQTAVIQLCNPDPDKRGHPLETKNGRNTYNIQRYVSLFDRLAKSFGRVEKNGT